MSKEIVILMLLALCTSSGLFLTAAACISGESMWPCLSLALCLCAMTPLFCCGLAEATMSDGGMPSYLRDTNDSEVTGSEIGWFIVGIFITAALAAPLVLARHRVMDMRTSWIASSGTWCTVLALATGAVLLIKGVPSSSSY